MTITELHKVIALAGCKIVNTNIRKGDLKELNETGIKLDPETDFE